MSRAFSELGAAVAEFKEHYSTFAEKNRQFVQIHDEVQMAIDKAGNNNDIKVSARIFEKEIMEILTAREKRQETAKTKWSGRLATFLSKLYPVANLSLRLTVNISEVIPLAFVVCNGRGPAFCHLKLLQMGWVLSYRFAFYPRILTTASQ